MTLSDLGLTARQEAFAYAVASQQHATDRDAAIHAGYGSAGAEQRASENRRKASVTTAIARLKAGTAERVDVSQDKLVAEFWDTYRAARQLETPNLTAARQCLDSLARITGLFDAHSTVDVQHSGTVEHLQSVSLDTLQELLTAIDSTVSLSIEAPDSQEILPPESGS
jgi:hypothetical protein